ncbi:hypothetical protein ACFW15_33420, partial [Streptomyces sp. NPDC058953]
TPPLLSGVGGCVLFIRHRDPMTGGDRGRMPGTAPESGAGEHRPAVTTLTIELSAGQLDHYAEAAAAHGLPVGQWAARVLDAARRRPA